MAYDAGTAHLQVVPSFRNIEAELAKLADRIGKQFGAAIESATTRGVADAVKSASRESTADVRRAGEDAGREFAGKFGEGFSRRLREAMRSLPAVDVNVDTRDGQVALASIREELARLNEQRIGVDIDEATALTQIRHLQGELDQLARNDPDIGVRVDSAAAAAELAAIQAQVNKLDGANVRVNGDGSGLDNISRAASTSLSRLEALIAISVSLGTALIPAAAAAATAIGFIGTAAASSVAGIGVMALGFSGVTDAVKALQAAEDDAKKSAASLARSQFQVAGASDAIASAERSLANVRANNADAARRGARAVEDAQRGVADAIRGVETAERDLVRAQVDARQSTLDLTRAREEARRALEDMSFDVKQLALDQEQANLDQAEAKKELDKLLANPRATEEQRKQAQITYDEITLRIQRLAVQQKRLQEDQTAANKAGVEGSRQVVAAQERVESANERVVDAQERVREANERVEQAQIRLADAVLAQASQQRQAAFAVAQAQQAVATAHRQAEAAAVRAGVAGGEALDNLNTIMEKLSPTAQRFARFIFDLRDEFRSLRAAAADNLLPGVQEAIEETLPFLPDFRRYLAQVAEAIGDMFAETTRFLSTDGTWRRFFSFIGNETVPTLERLYRISRNVATGMVGLLLAFTPFNEDIGGGLERLTERFANWAATLDRNRSFQSFLDYALENGPKVIDLIGELTEFVVRFIQAAAPIGTFTVQLFTALFRAINSLPIEVIELAARGLALLAASLFIVNTATRTWALVSALVDRLTGSYNRVRDAATKAVGQTDQFSRSLNGVEGSAGKARRGLGGLSSFLGGPWGAALAGATVGLGFLMAKQAEYESKIDGLRAALGDLGDAYRDLAADGLAAAQSTEEALRGIVRASPDMQRAIIALDDLGISFDQLAKAAGGSQADLSKILAVLDAEIAELGDRWQKEVLRFWDPGKAKGLSDRLAELRQTRQAVKEYADELGLANQAQDLMGQSSINLRQPHVDLSTAFSDNAARIQVLQGLVDAFSGSESTATDRVNALKAAVEQQTSAAINAIEQEEAWGQALTGLSASVQANGHSLSLHTAEGLRNRDALEAAALATRDMYLQAIASGVPLQEATKKHNDRVAALKEEARRLGLDKEATDKLIATYAQVPDEVKTAYTTKGFDQVWNELMQLKFIQEALAKGWTLEQAKKQWKVQEWWNKGFQGPPAPGRAQGGPIFGPGTATSDSILIRASDGEFMQPTASVDYYGQGFMEAIRRRLIPRDRLPGFATGGMIRAPFTVDLAKTLVPTLDEVIRAVVPAASPGGIGSADMMRILHTRFPGLALFSGYRPGSRTASGSLSYHAMIAADGDKGRAVDVPPIRDVFNFIHDNYLRLTKELIWLGDPNRNIWNGHHHRFSQSLLNQHGVAGMPNAHIHWAMDSGGMLEPGWNPPIWNGTGRPEPVLTDQQWREISRAARGGDEPREVHNWTFADTTLTPDLLQAWQDRRDALARVGRPR